MVIDRCTVAFCMVMAATLVIVVGGCARKDAVCFIASAEMENEPSMKNAVEEYWQALTDKDFEAAYSLEAPHIKYQVDFVLYENMFSRFKAPDKIEVVDIRRKDTLYEVVLNKYVCGDKIAKDSKCDVQVLLDYWIFMGGKWLHVAKNRFLFLGN